MIRFKYSSEALSALSYEYYGKEIGYYIEGENKYYLFNGSNYSSYHGMAWNSCRRVGFWWKGEKLI